jgi:hypothetical protein
MSITTSSIPAAAMEKSMSGPMQSPGRFKAFCPSSAHAPSQRTAGYRQRLTAVRRQQMSILFKIPPGTFAKYENLKRPAAYTLRDDHLVLLTIDRLLALHAAFRRWRKRRKTLRALADLDERQLRDIGLTRAKRITGRWPSLKTSIRNAPTTRFCEDGNEVDHARIRESRPRRLSMAHKEICR